MSKGREIPFWLKMATAIMAAIVSTATAVGVVGEPVITVLGGQTASAAINQQKENDKTHDSIRAQCGMDEILDVLQRIESKIGQR